LNVTFAIFFSRQPHNHHHLQPSVAWLQRLSRASRGNNQPLSPVQRSMVYYRAQLHHSTRDGGYEGHGKTTTKDCWQRRHEESRSSSPDTETIQHPPPPGKGKTPHQLPPRPFMNNKRIMSNLNVICDFQLRIRIRS
jgi:hypothetical protein